MKSIVLNSKLYSFENPIVMGIINMSQDSFAAHCGAHAQQYILQQIEAAPDWLDIGAFSTRPGHTHVSEQDEWARLQRGLDILKEYNVAIPVCVDTFRSEIARRAIEQYGVSMINDVSGLQDEHMAEIVAHHGTAYTLLCPLSIHDGMHVMTDFFARKIYDLQQMGVKDIVIDPGFGFGKTLNENYLVLKKLEILQMLDCPLMVGISRKSMIFNELMTNPMDASTLNGTSVLHLLALLRGADILRVHDIQEAKNVVRLHKKDKEICLDSE